MSQNDYSTENLCKKCCCRLFKLSKREIKGIVLTDYVDKCDNCGRKDYLVEYIEDGD